MQGQGYAWTPGIHSPEQVEGWRLVTDAVHDAGGLIFLQLWHVGRISHPSLQPDGMLPVAPSAIRPSGEAFVENENGEGALVPFVTPRALQIEEMPYLVRQYFRGARNALTAGFDGVEIHAANGYLLEQFIDSSTNRRDDRYGGPVEGRARLLMVVGSSASRGAPRRNRSGRSGLARNLRPKTIRSALPCSSQPEQTIGDSNGASYLSTCAVGRSMRLKIERRERATAVIDWRIVTHKCDRVAHKCYKKATRHMLRPSARRNATRPSRQCRGHTS